MGKSFNERRNDIIYCPMCGAEYLAGEIYIPNSFIGVPRAVERSSLEHKIIFDAGKMMDTNESYICDYCNTPFKVSASVKFHTSIDNKHNFNTNYKTSIKKSQLFLSED